MKTYNTDKEVCIRGEKRRKTEFEKGSSSSKLVYKFLKRSDAVLTLSIRHPAFPRALSLYSRVASENGVKLIIVYV